MSPIIFFGDYADSELISRQKGNHVIGAGRARDDGEVANFACHANIAGMARSYGIMALLNLIAVAVCLK